MEQGKEMETKNIERKTIDVAGSNKKCVGQQNGKQKLPLKNPQTFTIDKNDANFVKMNLIFKKL